ncbi:uncharacterized protein DFL_003414 [Arthrobotrys flagrans]|uniref:Uncharacterized protein n=1 Tax=Arthrobotrys flagrans TaxID=97331 RepID=A0A437A1Q1_ARTFL|nr:hypothetical protein DFL_003414 [Arthrobotrys flagrans]
MRLSLVTLDLVVLLSTWLPLSSALPTSPQLTTYQERNFKTIHQIYQFTIYPRQEAIIAQATNDSIPELEPLFSPTVSGRIQEIGNFTNFRHSIEYFFGLAPRPQGSMYSAIVEAELTQFSSDCPSVAASTVNFKVALADPSKPGFGAPGTRTYTYLKQTGFWHFDEQGRVDYYDLYISALNEFATILNGADFGSKLVQLLATKQICQGAQKLCKGQNTQYQPQVGLSVGAVLSALGLNLLLDLPLVNQLGLGTLNLGELTCFAKLSVKKFGTFDKLWADTVTCRIVHLMLAEVDPDDHCPHVGPSGGGKCVEYPYYDRLYNDGPLFRDNLRFRCPGYSNIST